MNVWVLFPSANYKLASETNFKWIKQGYKVGILTDDGPWAISTASICVRPYPGYWGSINALVAHFKSADVYVAAADDLDPDPNFTAQQIGQQFLERFSDGFGVMQPCGDLQGPEAYDEYIKRCPEALSVVPEVYKGKSVPAAARICGSPWFGRGWVERAYGGKGPMPTNYFNYYGDEELFEVARRLGVLWLRPDLTQFHHHWSFGHRPQADYNIRNQERWEQDQKTFFERKTAGFPGSEPL